MFIIFESFLVESFFPLLLCWVGVHCVIYNVLRMYQIYHT
jgi:hypothetical protein